MVSRALDGSVRPERTWGRLVTPSDIANLNASWIRARDAMDRFFSMATGKAGCSAREFSSQPNTYTKREGPDWATPERLEILDREYPLNTDPGLIYTMMQAEPGPRMPRATSVISYGVKERGLRRPRNIAPPNVVGARDARTLAQFLTLPPDEPDPDEPRYRGQSIRNLDLSVASPAGPPIIVALDVVRDWAEANRIPFAGLNLGAVNAARKQYGLPTFKIETFQRGR